MSVPLAHRLIVLNSLVVAALSVYNGNFSILKIFPFSILNLVSLTTQLLRGLYG